MATKKKEVLKPGEAPENPKRKYNLKKDVVLRPFGAKSMIDNRNLTDAIAEMLIKKGRASKQDFITKKAN